MKITFTGITREEAIRKIESSAAEKRTFAARISGVDAKMADTEIRKADRLEAIARMIETSESISISMKDEGLLYYALAHGLYTFDDADSQYKRTCETEEEREALIWGIRLAQGAMAAAKTE